MEKLRNLLQFIVLMGQIPLQFVGKKITMLWEFTRKGERELIEKRKTQYGAEGVRTCVWPLKHLSMACPWLVR